MIKHLRFSHSLALAALAVFMILPGWGWGQTPANGGFEDGTNSWTTTGTVGATNARTGAKALVSASSISTSNKEHTNSTIISIPNNSYAHVIGWALGSNTYSNASCGGTLNVTVNSAPTTNIGTTLTRLSYNVQNTSGSAVNFTCRVRCNGNI